MQNNFQKIFMSYPHMRAQNAHNARTNAIIIETLLCVSREAKVEFNTQQRFTPWQRRRRRPRRRRLLRSAASRVNDRSQERSFFFIEEKRNTRLSAGVYATFVWSHRLWHSQTKYSPFPFCCNYFVEIWAVPLRTSSISGSIWLFALGAITSACCSTWIDCARLPC